MAIASSLLTCKSWNNQQCMDIPTHIDLNPDEYNQGLPYDLFMVNLDKCTRSCNTLDDLSSKICVSNQIGNVNLSVFNMLTRMKKSKPLKNHVPCECNVNLILQNVIQIKREITKNVDMSAKKS